MQRDYVDFDLVVESPQHGEGFSARVTRSPAGEFSEPNRFTYPHNSSEVDSLIKRISGRKRGGPSTAADPIRGTSIPIRQAIEDFGRDLFGRVFQGSVIEAYRSSLGEAKSSGKGLRIRLFLAGCPELADLPWEYLFDPRRNFLSHSIQTPIVRFLDTSSPPRGVSAPGGLHVLAVLSSPPEDPDPLDTEAEWAALREALAEQAAAGTVFLERLPEPSWRGLNEWITSKTVHVLHFAGHGRFDDDQELGELLLHSENPKGEWKDANRIATILRDAANLGLVVLNACDGARINRRHPLGGVARALVDDGIAAVISMQFEITDRAAITFSRSIYRSLSEGERIDGAVASARKDIYLDGNDVEWGTPVLFSRATEMLLFQTSAKNIPNQQTTQDRQAPRASSLLRARTRPASRFALSEAPLMSKATPRQPYQHTLEVRSQAPASISATNEDRSRTANMAGSVIAWGHGNHGQLSIPTSWSNITKIAAGATHTVTLDTEGRAAIVGGQLQDLRHVSRVKDIAAGGTRTFLTMLDGSIVGYDSGPLRLIVPNDVRAVIAVACTTWNVILLHQDRSVAAFKAGTGESLAIPSECRGVRSVAAGGGHFLALLESGRVLQWSSVEDAHYPDIPGRVASIAAGKAFNLALHFNGTATIWGPRTRALPISSGPYKAVAVGDNHGLLLTEAGNVVTFGKKDFGLQDPPDIPGPVATIAAGSAHSAAVYLSQ